MSIFDFVKKQKSKTDKAIAEATGTPTTGAPSFKNVQTNLRSTELPAPYGMKRKGK